MDRDCDDVCGRKCDCGLKKCIYCSVSKADLSFALFGYFGMYADSNDAFYVSSLIRGIHLKDFRINKDNEWYKRYLRFVVFCIKRYDNEFDKLKVKTTNEGVNNSDSLIQLTRAIYDIGYCEAIIYELLGEMNSKLQNTTKNLGRKQKPAEKRWAEVMKTAENMGLDIMDLDKTPLICAILLTLENEGLELSETSIQNKIQKPTPKST